MNRWISWALAAVLALAATVALAKIKQIAASGDSVNISVGGATQIQLDDEDDDFFVFVGGKTVNFELEPDADGSEEVATVEVYSCSAQDTDSCLEFYWDSDYDGVPDTNELDGATLGKRGLQFVQVPFFLYFDTVTPPSSGTAIFSISAVAQGL